ncbi:hypothetical protein EDC01DRAFT_648075 [Geopyxis carbonaria]|nr:hypothetical protein EDC01DRAFT_648075 [Geopyxis carbonaria]
MHWRARAAMFNCCLTRSIVVCTCRHEMEVWQSILDLCLGKLHSPEKTPFRACVSAGSCKYCRQRKVKKAAITLKMFVWTVGCDCTGSRYNKS